MGAAEYEERIIGFGTAQEAFNYAVKEARYMYGHGGYTGTIAEKDSFRMVYVPPGEDPIQYAEKILFEDKSQHCDKWGPANCVEFLDERGRKGFYFFGIASS
jgi:hypothetical protein